MVPLLALIASFQFPPDSTSQLIGTWLNHDSSTQGVTQIAITSENGVLSAHAWGACVPSDCDWGVTALTMKEGTATAVFYTGPIETTMYLVRMPNDTLLAVYKSEMKDPEFKDQDHTESFDRAKPNPNDVSARGVLKRVAEAYGNLTSAEFEFEDADQSTSQSTATRSKSLTHLLISSSGRLREETSIGREHAIKISDGKTVWTYFPESNQYEMYPAGDQRSSIVDGYRSIDQVLGSTSVTGTERLGDVDCTLVKIKRPNSIRILWIDPKTSFILKDDATRTVSAPPNSETFNSVRTFLIARVLPSVDERQFSFDPKKVQAKAREELQRKARTESVGTQAPDFTLYDLENKPIKLSELKGKVVLLDFWATWCAPCRAAMPDLELLHRDFKDKGLVVLGVDSEEAKDQTAFFDKFGYTFHSLVDPEEQVKNLFAVGGIPTTVLIDRKGTIRVFEMGTSSYASLREAIRKIGIS